MNKIIKKELEEYKKFKSTYTFVEKKLEEKDGEVFCEGISLIDYEGKEIGDCEKWINVGYKLKGPYAKIFSNLFPYEFKFRNKNLNSIEAFFQGIKFKNIEIQNCVLKYSGLNSNYVKVISDINWKEDGLVYWQGIPIKRDSIEYDELVDELYICAIQNPLYRNALIHCSRDIIHTMGGLEKENTVFTRYEFEKQLNCLKDFLKKEST